MGWVEFYALGTGPTTDCLPWDGVLSGLEIISIVAAEGLLLIRTWISWSRRRIMLIGLIALILACLGASIAVDVLSVGSNYSQEPLPPSLSSCRESHQSFTSVWSFFGLAIFELVILILTIRQIFNHDRLSRIFVMIRNDIVYIICIMGMSVVNSIVIKAGYNQDPVLILQVVLHSVLACRLLFSLRQIMHQQHIMSISGPQPFTSVEMGSMVFAGVPGASSSAVGDEC
ncbi:hypothetical protein BJ138DRAFT_393727 [Hygrophoropsis aurantiaca]|uniref:Uncharacterized protein n=1 Tax=Hygrophoropsis aurantiaca TaxID=72124 RepID=A0ACB8A5Y7_9AGAM|nr:hypothetical protein BJ138DRAFT_393727 [Hygrophoropsis aurantiaca]